LLAEGADVEAAIVAVKPYATGSVQPDEEGRRLSVPVAAAEGLTTRVVRALDRAGVQVNDVTMQRASLDDVFLALTGHVSAPAEGTAEDTAEDTIDDEEGSEAALTAITAELVPEKDVTYGAQPGVALRHRPVGADQAQHRQDQAGAGDARRRHLLGRSSSS